MNITVMLSYAAKQRGGTHIMDLSKSELLHKKSWQCKEFIIKVMPECLFLKFENIDFSIIFSLCKLIASSKARTFS